MIYNKYLYFSKVLFEIINRRCLLSKNQLIGIDLFAGAGGLSLGAEQAGIKVKYAIENEKNAAETYRTNHKKTILIEKDISCVNLSEISVDREECILFGGAPCQGFSSSNRRTNNKNNPKNWLYLEFLRILNGIWPSYFVFENVTGLLNLDSGAFFKKILSDFESIGYKCTCSVLNAADFGVPQNRKRLFIVGSRRGNVYNLSSSKKRRKVTVAEAFHDLPELSNGAFIDAVPYSCRADSTYAKKMRGNQDICTGHLVSKNAQYVIDRYQYIEPGENWAAIPAELMMNYRDRSRCHTGIYYRLRPDEPSLVIGNYRKNMLIHPYENRGLSVREAARLQSFPDRYVFKGTLGFQQQQVGNAVPPLLAKHVFKTITDNI